MVFQYHNLEVNHAQDEVVMDIQEKKEELEEVVVLMNIVEIPKVVMDIQEKKEELEEVVWDVIIQEDKIIEDQEIIEEINNHV